MATNKTSDAPSKGSSSKIAPPAGATIDNVSRAKALRMGMIPSGGSTAKGTTTPA